EEDSSGRIRNAGPSDEMRSERSLDRQVHRQKPAAPPLGFADQNTVRRDVGKVEPERFRNAHAGRGQKPDEHPILPWHPTAPARSPIGHGDERGDLFRRIDIRRGAQLGRTRQQIWRRYLVTPILGNRDQGETPYGQIPSGTYAS